MTRMSMVTKASSAPNDSDDTLLATQIEQVERSLRTLQSLALSEHINTMIVCLTYIFHTGILRITFQAIYIH